MEIDLGDVKLSNKQLKGKLEVGARFVRNGRALVWMGSKARSLACWEKYKRNWAYRVIAASKRYDKVNNIFFELNESDVTTMAQQQEMKCHYCEQLMQTEKRTERDGCTVDRLDGNLGHTRDNCVLSCRLCNVTLGCSEMVQHLRTNRTLFRYFEEVIRAINSNDI